MAEAVSTVSLNDLLIQIGRSLLQYVDESWPWTDPAHEQARLTLQRIATAQRESAATLARLLDARGEAIDFGTYPTEYTSLHYVALEFLLDKVVQDQEAVVRTTSALAQSGSSDPEVGDVLHSIATAERQHLDELRQLASRS